ncbi:MAG: lycopene cyclase domain-containing protein [Chloroflexi bacterium]|nr:MAG: lycopene cyclase domain-containing protein [Chloroflexota bacterium]MBL1197030.1 lycopene cyclase domain-containing protein [Chloroflexota bacterium]NOH14325.1 lycopene cyclase domain-containing protein [Chloroflexota bacterium]
MTYFGFLALFVILPTLILIVLLWRKLQRNETIMLAVLVVIAVAYTTPWDNYLVATRVWWYDPALVTGITIWWVPIEEYSFFVLQTVMSGLWLLFLKRKMSQGLASDNSKIRLFSVGVVGLLWLGMVYMLISGWRPGTYLALELVWALPPILLQLAFGADILWHHRRLVGLAILSTTIYLSAADWIAIGSGTWTIDPEQSLNIFLGGHLPVEEAVFFLLTNTLVVFGLALSLAQESRARLPKWFPRRWVAVAEHL